LGSEIDSRSEDFIANSEQMRDRVKKPPRSTRAAGIITGIGHLDSGGRPSLSDGPGPEPASRPDPGIRLGKYRNRRRSGLRASMPGKITAELISEGEQVERSAPLIRLEAMTMEHTLSVRADGKICQLRAQPGQQVEEGQELLIIDS